MSEEIKDCKNCEKPFKEAYEYCPHCGQKDKDELTISVLFYNTISNYFSFDARFFKSFIPLLFRPGYLARKFVEGKRLMYLHPGQLYLFIAVVFFFLISFKTNEQARKMDEGLAEALERNAIVDSLSAEEIEVRRVKDSIGIEAARLALKKNSFFTGMTEKQIDSLVDSDSFNVKKNDLNFTGKQTDSLIKANAPDAEIYKSLGLKDDDSAFKKRVYRQWTKFLKSKQAGNIYLAFYDAAPIAMLFILPIFALILKLFYRKRGRYTHHLVFSFYYFAFLFTLFSLIIVINFIIDIPDWIDFLVVLSVFFYLIVALKRFYQQGWFKSFLKGSLTTMMFFPVLLVVTTCVFFFSFMFY